MDDVLEMNASQGAAAKRAIVEEMLAKAAPGADYADDDALFGRIIDDYAEHARLLAEMEERERQAELRGRNASIEQLMGAAQAPGDGIPRLGGAGSLPAPSASIFEVAKY